MEILYCNAGCCRIAQLWCIIRLNLHSTKSENQNDTDHLPDLALSRAFLDPRSHSDCKYLQLHPSWDVLMWPWRSRRGWARDRKKPPGRPVILAGLGRLVFEFSCTLSSDMIATNPQREATMAGKSPAAIHRENARTQKKQEKKQARLERKRTKRKGKAA